MDMRLGLLSSGPLAAHSRPPPHPGPQDRHAVVPQGGPQLSEGASYIQDPQKVREAVAVAIAERKDKVKASAVAWKKKALVARTSLLRVSKSLRKLSGAKDSAGHGIEARLLEALQVDAWDWQATSPDPGHEVADQQQHTTVANRCTHLEAFMEAVEVWHTSVLLRTDRPCWAVHRLSWSPDLRCMLCVRGIACMQAVSYTHLTLPTKA